MNGRLNLPSCGAALLVPGSTSFQSTTIPGSIHGRKKENFILRKRFKRPVWHEETINLTTVALATFQVSSFRFFCASFVKLLHAACCSECSPLAPLSILRRLNMSPLCLITQTPHLWHHSPFSGYHQAGRPVPQSCRLLLATRPALREESLGHSRGFTPW